MRWAGRMALVGGGAELAVAVPALVVAGGAGLAGALAGGALAAAAQAAAVAVLRPGMGAPAPAFVRRWAAGIAIRAGSALALVLMVIAARAVVPPLWSVLGFLAVLLTLLFVETRFLA
jgi:hypothetical protein